MRSDSHLTEFVSDQRPAEVVALNFVAALTADQIELSLGFHALGDSSQVEGLSDADDQFGQRIAFGFRVRVDIRNEGTIYFEFADLEALEI